MNNEESQFDYNIDNNGLPESYCPLHFSQCLIEAPTLESIGQMCIDDQKTQNNIDKICKMARRLEQEGVHGEYDFDEWILLTRFSIWEINEYIEMLHTIQSLLQMFLEYAEEMGLLTQKQAKKVSNLDIHPLPDKHYNFF